jgi:hypothetical protein
MTTPYIPQQPPQLPPGIQYAQQPNYAPPPAYPQQGPPQYQQPYIPPQQPQYQQPYQPPQGMDRNTRLSGPGIPQELQGRTVGEALQYYGIMREDFVRRNQPQQQPPQYQQPQPQQQPYQPPQYQQPQQQQGPPSAQPRGPQQQQQQPVDPMRQIVVEAVREAMPQMLEPLVQPMRQGQVEKAFSDTRMKFAQDPMVPFDRVAGEVVQSLQGADAQTLANPAAWEAAYYHAKGLALSRPQGQQQQPPQGGPQYQPYPQQPSFQQVTPQTQPSAAFIEGPTPPAPSLNGGFGGGSADPRDEIFARRFGVPVEVYRSWKPQQGQQQGPIGLMKQPTPFGGVPPQNAFGGPPVMQQPMYQQPPGWGPQAFQQPMPYQRPVPPGWYDPNLSGGGYSGF